MTDRNRQSIWQVLVVLAIAAGLLSGCGKKGPPRPPQLPPAPVVKDLKADLAGDRLQLSWTLTGAPELRRAGFERFSVYRARTALSEAECRSCPILFLRVAQVPLSDASNAGGKAFGYRDSLEKGYRYRYKVSVDAAGGSPGPDSNVVEFTY